ncbi:MAG TPA: hypothetical protein GXZ51_02055 [Acholeplasma sp.]|nr:hypothetical protein [Acholeplasma sp.]
MKSEKSIKERIYSVLPIGSLSMMEFFKILKIRFTDDVPTAAITTSTRPELLLNKSFIEKYCKTNEHLLMLIMHELYHIILGHTRIFKRHTMLDNLAFDAVINAILCRLFPKEEYVSFFENANSDAFFPSCLLRPRGENTPQEFHKILKNLYKTNTGTYFEVYKVICKTLKDKELGEDFILLGNHSYDDASNNPLIKDMIDSITDKWEINKFGDKKLFKDVFEGRILFKKVKRVNQIKMRRLLIKAGIIDSLASNTNVSSRYMKTETVSFVPNFKDRTVFAKSYFYGMPLLYNSEVDVINQSLNSRLKALVYLDVSGSVYNSINSLASLLLKPYKNGECLLFAFSTIVDEVAYENFRKGKYKTTGGTDINCIFDHYFSLPKSKQTNRILILTDGFTGRVDDKFYNEIKSKDLEIYCGLFGKEQTKKDLQSVVKYFEEFKGV